MRIGIMLRHLGQHGGGVLVYTQNLVRELIALGTGHEFVLMYRDAEFLGSFGRHSNVREAVLRAPNTLLWDQWAVWRAESREGLDVIFNPKYSVPLMAKGPTAWVCHGLDWYVMPWGSKFADRMNHRFLIPRFARKATAILAVSDVVRDHLREYLGVPTEKIHRVYLGLTDAFRTPPSSELLDAVRTRYDLPDRFFLYCGQIYPPKNFGRLIEAYACVGPSLGVPLVVAGSHTWLSDPDIKRIDELGVSDWVIRTGWVEHESLPALYASAAATLLPSLYEACPSPILEAMASGCPVVTSDRYGTAEIAGGAALLVNPESVESIADGMRRVIEDEGLRERLVSAGFVRASQFDWKQCAQQTLAVLESLNSIRR